MTVRYKTDLSVLSRFTEPSLSNVIVHPTVILVRSLALSNRIILIVVEASVSDKSLHTPTHFLFIPFQVDGK